MIKTLLDLVFACYSIGEISIDEHNELRAAIATTGKREGRLKKKSPAYDRVGAIAWNVLALEINACLFEPFKTMMNCHDKEAGKLFERLSTWTKKYSIPIQVLGQSGLEFSLFYFNHDEETLRVRTLDVLNSRFDMVHKEHMGQDRLFTR
jgi:hypothetical protein